MVIDAPCKDCEERYLHCHDECEKFKVWIEIRRQRTHQVTEGEKYDVDRWKRTFLRWLKRRRR